MSATVVIVVIIAVLVLLVAFTFISQTIERKRKQRQRMLSSLRLRSQDFKYLITGFPDQFLPKELNALVHRCLIDVCEQLATLEPKVKTHVDELAYYTQQMEAIQRRPKAQKRPSLKDPQQVKDVKLLLQGLNSFIATQRSRGHLTEQQYSKYSNQIKKLVVQITVDTYLVNAKQAHTSSKYRLAIHFYGLARKLLAKESGESNYQKQIQQLSGVIEKLEAQAAAEGTPVTTVQTGGAVDSEWEKFEEAEEKWKKKSLYD